MKNNPQSTGRDHQIIFVAVNFDARLKLGSAGRLIIPDTRIGSLNLNPHKAECIAIKHEEFHVWRYAPDTTRADTMQKLMPKRVEKTFQGFKQDTLKVDTHEVKDTTPIRLEFLATIWALETLPTEIKSSRLTLYNHVKTIADAFAKRPRLEQTDFAGTRPGKPITNVDLYKDLYKLHDRLGFEISAPDILNEKDKGIYNSVYLEVFNHADRALKTEIKAQNKVADKWF
ncbi:MAG: hypothetical protein HQM16_02495 [Deltaproteobacteria bacterium]|nr:hypothetical protein [Deltaproteobacteria bacterium]